MNPQLDKIRINVRWVIDLYLSFGDSVGFNTKIYGLNIVVGIYSGKRLALDKRHYAKICQHV